MGDARVSSLSPLCYRPIVEDALREDLGRGFDLTTDTTVPRSAMCSATVLSRVDGVLAGLGVAGSVFDLLSSNIMFRPEHGDGDRIGAGEVVARVEGPAHAVLTGERTFLNFLAHLSGIATLTRDFVDRVAETEARIVCTRKTTPLLRVLEKYAVRCGGGMNHRFGLDDGVLIKENHIEIAGGVAQAVKRVRSSVGHTVLVEVEIENHDQLIQALDAGADAVLLDNMSIDDLRRAVDLVDRRLVTEASGGMRLERVSEVAATGVDLISVGALTHSAVSLDLSLRIGEPK